MLSLFARVAHLIFVSDIRITFVDVITHDTFFAHSDNTTVFLNVIVLLTIKALSERAVLSELFTFFHLVDLHQVFNKQTINHCYRCDLRVQSREYFLFSNCFLRSCHLRDD